MKSENSKARRVRAVISQVVFYVLLALIVLAAVFLVVRGRQSRPTFMFGRTFLWVETGSMKPTIDERSYVLVKEADGSPVEVGDVIVFPCPDPESPIYGSLIIHRVVEVSADGYRTKGDNDKSFVDSWVVAPGDVVAVWERNLGVMTFIGRLFSSPLGFVMLCALFLAMCSFVYIPSIVRTLREDAEKQSAADRDAEIERRVKAEVERLEKEGKK